MTPASNPSARVRKLVVPPQPLALVAVAFCLGVSGYLLYQHARSSERDPWKSPQLLALKEKLRAAPTDETIKSEIRRLDLEFRQRYVHRLALNRTGGWLLVGGMMTALAATRRIVNLKSLPWLPRRRDHEASAENLHPARRAVTTTALGFGLALLGLALTSTSPLPRAAAEITGLLNGSAPPHPAPAPATPAEFQANWPQFRGWSGAGVVAESARLDLRPATVIWQTAVPAPGFNSPIVWSNRLFLSGATALKREVFCFNTDKGQLVWHRAVENIPGSPAEVLELPEMTGYAAPTMATDGQRAFVIFPNGDLAAFNFDGSRAWAKHLGVPKSLYGYAASLAIWPGTLVVQWDQDEAAPGGSKLLAFDCATGNSLWARTKPTHGSWASPVIAELAGKTQVITLALPHVMSHALLDGAELWRAELLSGEIAPSPLAAGGLVLAPVPSSELAALRPDGTGDVTKSHLLWRGQKQIPDITSPVGNEKFVFTLTTMGGLAGYETATGQIMWQKELGFETHASPAIVGEQLVVLGTKGEVAVLQAGREFAELRRWKLDDQFQASPAFAAGRMFLRGATNLWCVGNN